MNAHSRELPPSVTELVLGYKRQIEAALRYSDQSHTFDDVLCQILRGKAHFYPLDGAFVIMEVLRYSQWSSYHVFLAGGDLKAILAVQESMKENARRLGCKKITLTGRKGFTRVLPKKGWKHTLSLMELDLD